ncbi:MAG: pantoate--beta-alanine ligase [Denitrovibrio sp.]|nr:MAG: pantoate--beta-alanine ligase [Denitrovibrio sp.]
MKIIETAAETKAEVKRLKMQGKTVGMVPTMGFLHEGHMSLVKQSVEDNDVTVVSIFVNPTQFGPNEDLEAYPRDFEKDKAMLTEAGADIIFYPSVDEMYPEGAITMVKLASITETLCGVSRPGHFDGVATIVCKLFNIASPDRAYFGSKDYQQLQVIKRMVKDLNMDIEVIDMPIVREEDGLAMSSRNIYLKPEERESALSLSRSFEIVERLIDAEEISADVVQLSVEEFIAGYPHTEIDYIEIVHPERMTEMEKLTEDFVVALAVKVGRARLIDNKFFSVKK